MDIGAIDSIFSIWYNTSKFADETILYAWRVENG